MKEDARQRQQVDADTAQLRRTVYDMMAEKMLEAEADAAASRHLVQGLLVDGAGLMMKGPIQMVRDRIIEGEVVQRAIEGPSSTDS